MFEDMDEEGSYCRACSGHHMGRAKYCPGLRPDGQPATGRMLVPQPKTSAEFDQMILFGHLTGPDGKGGTRIHRPIVVEREDDKVDAMRYAWMAHERVAMTVNRPSDPASILKGLTLS